MFDGARKSQAAIDAANAEYERYAVARGELPRAERQAKNPGRAAIVWAVGAVFWLATALVVEHDVDQLLRAVVGLAWLVVTVGHYREWRRQRLARGDARAGEPAT